MINGHPTKKAPVKGQPLEGGRFALYVLNEETAEIDFYHAGKKQPFVKYIGTFQLPDKETAQIVFHAEDFPVGLTDYSETRYNKYA